MGPVRAVGVRGRANSGERVEPHDRRLTRCRQCRRPGLMPGVDVEIVRGSGVGTTIVRELTFGQALDI